MTSGEFHSIIISEINVKRDERQRRNPLIDIEILAESISRLGLIHPIVVTPAFDLVAGERRLLACRDILGWDRISVQYTNELNEKELRKIELEENVKRLNVEWKDECLAINEFNELCRVDDPSWTQDKTAEAMGLSKGAVSQKINAAKKILAGNERIIAAKEFSKARGIMKRERDHEVAAEQEAVRDILFPDAPKQAEAILTANFLEWAPAYSGPRFNFIHCDFPYGIGADKFNQGSAPTHGGYDDTPETYWALIDCLRNNLDRIASDSCHLLFWFSMDWYTETLELLRRDWEVTPFPLIWFKSDGMGILPDPSRGPRRIYETAFLGHRGDRKVVRAVSNAYGAPTDRTIHMSIKPEPMLRYFFGMLVDEHTRMLDPTCGSGSAIRAAESMGAAQAVGLEMNEEFAENARLLLRQARARGGFKFPAKQDA
jgi:ParB-like chromosome segregation protein Spo0J